MKIQNKVLEVWKSLLLRQRQMMRVGLARPG